VALAPVLKEGVCSSELQCVAEDSAKGVQVLIAHTSSCRVLQCAAVYCKMLQCDAVRAVDDSIGATGRSVLQSVAVCLQSAMVCCYELQSDAVWC